MQIHLLHRHCSDGLRTLHVLHDGLLASEAVLFGVDGLVLDFLVAEDQMAGVEVDDVCCVGGFKQQVDVRFLN